jgi:hypothetical protein
MTVINPHLVATTYSQIRPGDRVVNGFLSPRRVDAHLIARPVVEIVQRYRVSGIYDHGVTVPRNDRFEVYDHEVIEWRDTNGSLFTDCGDDPVYIVPAP